MRLIGETLAALAAGLGIAVTADPTADGYDVAIRLLSDDRPESGALVEGCLEAACRALADDGSSVTDAEPVLIALSEIVRHYASRAAVLASAAEPSSDPAAEQLPVVPAITLAVISAAVRDGAWPAEIDARLATGVLDAIVASALADPERLALVAQVLPTAPPLPPPEVSAAATPATPDTAETTSVAASAASAELRLPPVSQADQDVARATGLSPQAVRNLRALLPETELSDTGAEQGLGERARGLVALATRLAHASADPLSAIPAGAEAASALQAGLFDRTDQVLGAAEDAYLRAAQQDLGRASALMARAAELRAARADLAGALGAYQRAARHMLTVLRYLPASELVLRSRTHLRRGAYLQSAARHGETGARLREAAAAFQAGANEAEAGGFAELKAHALVEWSGVAIALARAEQDPRIAGQAADAIGIALPALPISGVDGAWGLAQLRLGHAVLLSANGAPDTARLASAAEAFAAAVSTLGPDRRPAAWLEARGWHGLTLVRLAAVTGDRNHADRALADLEAAFTAPDFATLFHAIAGDLAAALGDVAQAAGYRRGDIRLLALAAAAYRVAADSVVEGASGDLVGHFEEQRGACLKRVGETTGDLAALRAAAEAYDLALVAAEAKGDRMRSGLLRGELDVLRNMLDAAVGDGRLPGSIVL